MKHELDRLLGENIVKIIKLSRIKWYEHINKRERQMLIKKFTRWKQTTQKTLRSFISFIKDTKDIKISERMREQENIRIK